MFHIRSTYFRKRTRYHLECSDASPVSNSPSDLAVFDRLEDAAIAFRYLTGGNLTEADLIKAREIFHEQDAKHKEAGN